MSRPQEDRYRTPGATIEPSPFGPFTSSTINDIDSSTDPLTAFKRQVAAMSKPKPVASTSAAAAASSSQADRTWHLAATKVQGSQSSKVSVVDMRALETDAEQEQAEEDNSDTEENSKSRRATGKKNQKRSPVVKKGKQNNKKRSLYDSYEDELAGYDSAEEEAGSFTSSASSPANYEFSYQAARDKFENNDYYDRRGSMPYSDDDDDDDQEEDEAEEDTTNARRSGIFPDKISVPELRNKFAKSLAPSTGDFSPSNPRKPESYNQQWLGRGRPPKPSDPSYKDYKDFQRLEAKSVSRKWKRLVDEIYSDNVIRLSYFQNDPVMIVVNDFVGKSGLPTADAAYDFAQITTVAYALSDKIKDMGQAAEARFRRQMDADRRLEEYESRLEADLAMWKDPDVAFWMNSSGKTGLFYSAAAANRNDEILSSLFDILRKSHYFLAYSLWVNKVTILSTPMDDSESGGARIKTIQNFKSKVAQVREELPFLFKENGLDVVEILTNYGFSYLEGMETNMSLSIKPEYFQEEIALIAGRAARPRSSLSSYDTDYRGYADKNQTLQKLWSEISMVYVDEWGERLPGWAQLVNEIKDMERNDVTIDGFTGKLDLMGSLMKIPNTVAKALVSPDKIASFPSLEPRAHAVMLNWIETYAEFVARGLDSNSAMQALVVDLGLQEEEEEEEDESDDDAAGAGGRGTRPDSGGEQSEFLDDEEDLALYDSGPYFPKSKKKKLAPPFTPVTREQAIIWAKRDFRRRLTDALRKLHRIFSSTSTGTVAIQELGEACYDFVKEINLDRYPEKQEGVYGTDVPVTSWSADGWFTKYDQRFEDLITRFDFETEDPIVRAIIRDELALLAPDAPYTKSDPKYKQWELLKRMEVFINICHFNALHANDQVRQIYSQTMILWEDMDKAKAIFDKAFDLTEDIAKLYMDYVEFGYNEAMHAHCYDVTQNWTNAESQGNSLIFNTDTEITYDTDRILQRFTFNPTNRLRLTPVFGRNLITGAKVDHQLNSDWLQVTGLTQDQANTLYYTSQFYRASLWLMATKAPAYVSLRLLPLSTMFQVEIIRQTLGVICNLARGIKVKQLAMVKRMRIKRGPVRNPDRMLTELFANEETRNIILAEAKTSFSYLYSGVMFLKASVRAAFTSSEEYIRTYLARSDFRWRFFDMAGIFYDRENANSDFSRVFVKLATIMRAQINETSGIALASALSRIVHQVEVVNVHERLLQFEPLSRPEDYKTQVPQFKPLNQVFY